MSERGAAFGPFLLGLGLGAVLGFLFAPEPGEASRTKLSHKLRGLRDLAAEKAGELGELLETAEDEEEDAPTARVAIERRLTEAKSRRRGAKRGGRASRRRTNPAREGRARLASVGDRHRPSDVRGGFRRQYSLPRERAVVRSAVDHHPVRRPAARHSRLSRAASDHDPAGRAARAACPAAPP